LFYAVYYKIEVIKEKRNRNKVSVISEWEKNGKPVDIYKLKKENFYEYVNVSGKIHNNMIVTNVTPYIRSKLRKGQRFHIEDTPYKVTGYVKYVSSYINDLSGLYRVVLELDKGLRTEDNNIVVCSINVANYGKKLLIPVSAIVREDDSTYCWIELDGFAYKKKIDMGRQSSLYAEVKSGINRYDNIIVNGYSDISDKEKVIVHKIIDKIVGD
jgi:hypothetical protein